MNYVCKLLSASIMQLVYITVSHINTNYAFFAGGQMKNRSHSQKRVVENALCFKVREVKEQAKLRLQQNQPVVKANALKVEEEEKEDNLNMCNVYVYALCNLYLFVK